jgi:serine protease Do
MGKMVVGGASAVALLAILSAVTPVEAQGSGRPFPRIPDIMMLQGGGSEIGVSIRDLTSDEVAKAKLTQPGGVLVQDVREGSPASRAGLMTGDIIVEFDGERVRSASQFTRLVRETAPGRQVTSSVVRSESRRDVQIIPDTGDRVTRLPDLRPLEPRLRALPEIPDLDPTPDLRMTPRGQIGVTLVPLTEQLAAYFGTKEGVLVSTVVNGSAAAQAGLKAGDVITDVNGRRIQSAADMTRIVRDAKPGTALDMRVLRDKKEMTMKVIVPDLVSEPQTTLPV